MRSKVIGAALALLMWAGWAQAEQDCSQMSPEDVCKGWRMAKCPHESGTRINEIYFLPLVEQGDGVKVAKLESVNPEGALKIDGLEVRLAKQSPLPIATTTWSQMAPQKMVYVSVRMELVPTKETTTRNRIDGDSLMGWYCAQDTRDASNNQNVNTFRMKKGEDVDNSKFVKILVLGRSFD
jgi:hypothetical protein